MIIQGLKAIAFSNIIISIGAGCFYLSTGFRLNANLSLAHFTFICCSTFITYTYMRVAPFLRETPMIKAPESAVWIYTHKRLYLFLGTSCIFIILWTLLFFDLYDITWSIAMFFICALYQGLITKKINLRKIPFLKNSIIALVWTLMSICFFQSSAADNIQLISSNFLFIFILCIPFDLMEKEVDRLSGLKTLAHLSPKYIHQLMLINILIGIYIFFSNESFIFYTLFGIIINLCIYPKVNRISYLNFILADGLIILGLIFQLI